MFLISKFQGKHVGQMSLSLSHVPLPPCPPDPMSHTRGLSPPRLCPPMEGIFIRQSTKSLAGQMATRVPWGNRIYLYKFHVSFLVLRWNICYSGLRTAVALGTVSCFESCQLLFFRGSRGWIGLTDRKKEGTFVGFDDRTCEYTLTFMVRKTKTKNLEPVQKYMYMCSCLGLNILAAFRNFRDGKPDGGSSANCVSMWSDGAWTDANCDHSDQEWQYVCERGPQSMCFINVLLFRIICLIVWIHQTSSKFVATGSHASLFSLFTQIAQLDLTNIVEAATNWWQLWQQEKQLRLPV